MTPELKKAADRLSRALKKASLDWDFDLTKAGDDVLLRLMATQADAAEVLTAIAQHVETNRED